MKKALIVLIVFTGVLIVFYSVIFAVTGFDFPTMHDMMHGRFFPLHGIFMGGFWFLVILVLVVSFQEVVPARRDKALSTLEERLAKGEIDKETYRDIKRTLEGER